MCVRLCACVCVLCMSVSVSVSVSESVSVLCACVCLCTKMGKNRIAGMSFYCVKLIYSESLHFILPTKKLDLKNIFFTEQ